MQLQSGLIPPPPPKVTPFPRAFIVELMAALVTIYWGVCLLLPGETFQELRLFANYQQYPFTENQAGVFLVIVGICTASATLTNAKFLRCAALVFQTFVWFFVLANAFIVVPTAPSNSLFLLMLFMSISAFVQVLHSLVLPYFTKEK